jgi:hypothetical protein
MENKKLFDTRVVNQNIQKGLIKEADLKAHLKTLPDEKSNATWIEMDIHDTTNSDLNSEEK